MSGVAWARARDMWSDKPFGRLSHAWTSLGTPFCRVNGISQDAGLAETYGRCKRCEKAIRNHDRLLAESDAACSVHSHWRRVNNLGGSSFVAVRSGMPREEHLAEGEALDG